MWIFLIVLKYEYKPFHKFHRLIEMNTSKQTIITHCINYFQAIFYFILFIIFILFLFLFKFYFFIIIVIEYIKFQFQILTSMTCQKQGHRWVIGWNQNIIGLIWHGVIDDHVWMSISFWIASFKNKATLGSLIET